MRRFNFVLLEEFTLLSFAAAIETLRIANRMAERDIYTWRFLGEGGESVGCSAGTTFQLDDDLIDLTRDDVIMICGGVNVQAASTKRVVSWLRREARKGVKLAGLCTAAYTMAKAGLLDGKRATIHWENQDSFTEEFPEVELTKSVFVVDGNRITTAGGTSSIDMMLKIIADDHSEDLANAVADQMIYSSIRTDQDTQRLSVPTRIGVRHPKLSQVIQFMEQNIEEPISPSILAQNVGMSTRQLERLFRRYLNRSPKRYYMQLRLQKARNLLMQTDMSVINVALACGFASPSHFSKCYRAQYNTTPYRERVHRPRACQFKASPPGCGWSYWRSLAQLTICQTPNLRTLAQVDTMSLAQRCAFQKINLVNIMYKIFVALGAILFASSVSAASVDFEGLPTGNLSNSETIDGFTFNTGAEAIRIFDDNPNPRTTFMLACNVTGGFECGQDFDIIFPNATSMFSMNIVSDESVQTLLTLTFTTASGLQVFNFNSFDGDSNTKDFVTVAGLDAATSVSITENDPAGLGFDDIRIDLVDPNVVPLPAGLPLMLAGLGALAITRRKKS